MEEKDKDRLTFQLIEEFQERIEYEYFNDKNNISLLDDNIPYYFNCLRRRKFQSRIKYRI